MTAVEFIVDKLTPSNWTKEQMQEHYKDAIEQAKEMEKQEEQEKIDFADKYGTYLLQGGIMSAAAYNETFKSE